jgi:hypothetical protein
VSAAVVASRAIDRASTNALHLQCCENAACAMLATAAIAAVVASATAANGGRKGNGLVAGGAVSVLALAGSAACQAQSTGDATATTVVAPANAMPGAAANTTVVAAVMATTSTVPTMMMTAAASLEVMLLHSGDNTVGRRQIVVVNVRHLNHNVAGHSGWAVVLRLALATLASLLAAQFTHQRAVARASGAASCAYKRGRMTWRCFKNLAAATHAALD